MPQADAHARQLAHRLRAEALFGVDIVPLPRPLPPVEDDAPTRRPTQAGAERSAAPGTQPRT
ncbi:MAG: hypothetical protein AAF823_10080, partial [Planctomycetota bacterium]